MEARLKEEEQRGQDNKKVLQDQTGSLMRYKKEKKENEKEMKKIQKLIELKDKQVQVAHEEISAEKAEVENKH